MVSQLILVLLICNKRITGIILVFNANFPVQGFKANSDMKLLIKQQKLFCFTFNIYTKQIILTFILNIITLNKFYLIFNLSQSNFTCIRSSKIWHPNEKNCDVGTQQMILDEDLPMLCLNVSPYRINQTTSMFRVEKGRRIMFITRNNNTKYCIFSN